VSDTIIGSPASGPITPPDYLDIPVPPRRPSLLLTGVDRVKYEAEQLCVGYDEATSGGRTQALLKWRLTNDRLLRSCALSVVEAGADGYQFAYFVVSEFARTRSRIPYPPQVFGYKAVLGWLPAYKRRYPRADAATREATPERRQEYAERMKHDRFPFNVEPECGQAFERIGALDGSGVIKWRHCNLSPGHRPPCERVAR
jgi:hypothetical protein